MSAAKTRPCPVCHGKGKLALLVGGLSWAVVGAHMADARVEKGITQMELAKAIGLSRASIANMEGGRQRLQLDALVDACKVLDLDIGKLLSESGL